MSIESLFTHHAEWYRPLPTEDERNRGELFEPLGLMERREPNTLQNLNCRPDQAWAGVQQDFGPGSQQDRVQRWFLHKGFEGIAELDILAVTEGQLTGVQLQVVSVTPQERRVPGLHHVEVNVEVWRGQLTETQDEYGEYTDLFTVTMDVT